MKFYQQEDELLYWDCIHDKDQGTSLRDSIKVTKNGEVFIGNPYISSACMNMLVTSTNFSLPIDRIKKYFGQWSSLGGLEETQPHCLQPSCKFQHLAPTTCIRYVCGLCMGVQLRHRTLVGDVKITKSEEKSGLVQTRLTGPAAIQPCIAIHFVQYFESWGE